MKIIKEKLSTYKIGRGATPKYGFDKLQLDDCLIIDPENDLYKQIHRVRSATFAYKKHNGLVDNIYKVLYDKESNKIKVYRVK